MYRRETGEVSLNGEDGPMSKYAVSTSQNSWPEDEQIISLTQEEAMAWAKEHFSADEHEAIFGEVEE